MTAHLGQDRNHLQSFPVDAAGTVQPENDLLEALVLPDVVPDRSKTSGGFRIDRGAKQGRQDISNVAFAQVIDSQTGSKWR